MLSGFVVLSATGYGSGRPEVRPLIGVVQVTPAGPVRVVTSSLLGLNGVNVTGPPWNAPSFGAALRRFAPGVIRYPGGNAANYWSWPDGWFQPGHWPGEPSQPVNDRLPLFTAGVRASAALPLFDLNTVTYHGAIGSAALNKAMLDQQLKFLRAASAQGLPIRMVELGNELYQNGYTSHPPNSHSDDWARRFPTAADYARQMNAWITAIHREFPHARVAAVAADANDIPGISRRRRSWNAEVLPLLRGEDAVTIHENLYIYGVSPPSTVLAMPYLHFRKLKTHELALFRSYGLPVWITEFNMTDVTPSRAFQGTWLHGLFVAEEALLFGRNPAIKYAGLNATVGTAQSAAFFDGPHGFGSSGPRTVPLGLTAAGTTLAAVQAAFHRATHAQPLSFSPDPALGSSTAPSLLGAELTGHAGKEVILVNLSSRPVTLNLSAIFRGKFTVTQITAPSIMTLVTGPGSTERSSSSATGDFRIKPYALVDMSG